MRLFEEYLDRHNIADVPLVHHCTNGTLLLETVDFTKSRWQSRWILFSIKLVEHDHRPGQYQIEMNTPIHDGYLKGIVFQKGSKLVVKWHKYEDFILEWASCIQAVKPINGKRELILAAWEMFVYIFDGWFIKQPIKLKEKLFKSLDKENSVETRYSYYQDVAIFLSTHHPAVLRTWKYEVLANTQNHADWLACLIERKYASEAQKKLV